MKTGRVKKSLLFSFLGLVLALAGFGVGKWSDSDKGLENQPGVLVLEPDKKLKVKVWYVIDGDTLHVIGGERIRLAGIDAPGLNEAGGGEALRRLQILVENKEVELELDYEAELDLRDRYGRLLAYIWKGDVLVNEELLKNGVVKLLPEEYLRKTKYKERLVQAQEYAQKNKLGLWEK